MNMKQIIMETGLLKMFEFTKLNTALPLLFLIKHFGIQYLLYGPLYE